MNKVDVNFKSTEDGWSMVVVADIELSLHEP